MNVSEGLRKTERAQRKAPSSVDYDSVVAKVLGRVQREAARDEEGDLRTKLLLEHLVTLGPQERFIFLLAAPELQDRRVCCHFLEQAEASVGDSTEMESWARLALEAAQRLDPTQVPPFLIFDFQMEAWLLIGMAQASRSALEAASVSFQCAECFLGSGTGEPKARARLLRARARLFESRGEVELARWAHRAAQRTGEISEAEGPTAGA